MTIIALSSLEILSSCHPREEYRQKGWISYCHSSRIKNYEKKHSISCIS